MTQHELNTIIQSLEGFKTEFKRSVNSDLQKEIVAFANSSGGKVLIGVEDDGVVKGINIDNNTLSKIQSIARDCDPPILIRLESVNNVLVVDVPEGKNKPYRCTNGFYVRNGPNSEKLDTEEIGEFFQEHGRVKFDEAPNSKVRYPAHINGAAIKWYKEISGIAANVSDDELLVNLGVLDYESSESIINNTGILFFAAEPAKYLPQSAVVVLLIKGIVRLTSWIKKHSMVISLLILITLLTF